MIGVSVAPGPYAQTYDSIEACAAATFRHRTIIDPPFVKIGESAFVLIPKNASRSLLAIGHPVPASSLPIYAVIRDPLDRFLSAWRDKPAWRTQSPLALLEALEAEDLGGIDVHLRPQTAIASRHNISGFLLFDRLDADMKTLGIERFPHRNATNASGAPDDLRQIARKIDRLYGDDAALYRRLGRVASRERLDAADVFHSRQHAR